MDSEKLVMEVNFEQMTIPCENLAQLIWLHDRGWDANTNKKQRRRRRQRGQRIECSQSNDHERITGADQGESPIDFTYARTVPSPCRRANRLENDL